MRYLAIVFSLLCGAIYAGDKESDSFWYHGSYELVTKSCKLCNELVLSPILVKKMFGARDGASLVLALNPKDDYNEINVPIYYSDSTFVFDSDVYKWCEDPDCVGMGSVKGKLFRKDNAQFIELTGGFFKASYPVLYTFDETLLFKMTRASY